MARHAVRACRFRRRSPEPGPAAWFIIGIHGEEPAGPNTLAGLGEQYAVGFVPLANPHGYVRNWATSR
jgi:hypothetical protein